MFACRSVVVYEVLCPYVDPPTIGPRTIETMKRAGGHAIAIEAGKTILIDREKTLNDEQRGNEEDKSTVWKTPYIAKVI